MSVVPYQSRAREIGATVRAWQAGTRWIPEEAPPLSSPRPPPSRAALLCCPTPYISLLPPPIQHLACWQIPTALSSRHRTSPTGIPSVMPPSLSPQVAGALPGLLEKISNHAASRMLFSQFLLLPVELICCTLSFLEMDDLLACMQVCAPSFASATLSFYQYIKECIS